MQLVLFALQILEESTNAAEPADTIHNQLLLFGIQFIPGHVQRDSACRAKRFKFREQRPVFWLGPGFDGAFIQGLALVGDDQVKIDVDGVAEALAARASAIRIVE